MLYIAYLKKQVMAHRCHKWRKRKQKVLTLLESDDGEESSQSLLLNRQQNTNCVNAIVEPQHINVDNDDECIGDSSSDSSSCDSLEFPESSFREDLASCASKNNWTQSSVNELLSILVKHGHTDIPKDARTLLGTPRNVPVQEQCGGQYIYLGIKSGLEKILNGLDTTDTTCNLIFNIDGLPLYRSAATAIWPILCSFDKFGIFIVALFCGDKKPDPLDEYLGDFLEEWQQLSDTGFVYNGVQYQIMLKAFLCDTPARAFLKCITYTGYYACERCIVKGGYNGRVIYTDITDYPRRTDEGFQEYLYPGQQKSVSPLVAAGISCVSGFVLDYMHCVMLGVTRRLMNAFKVGKGRLSSIQFTNLSERLVSLNGSLPSEFSRQPRSLSLLDRWKATEYRQFLLYTGPVLLRDILSYEQYTHFLSLSIAISILLDSCDEYRMSYINFAGKLLKYFVGKSSEHYGSIFPVYNVHCLLHLHEDVIHHQCSLNEISCFPFENYMQRIKKFVRSNHNPLTQVCKRQMELEQCKVPSRKKKLFMKVEPNDKDGWFYLKNQSAIARITNKSFDGSLECDIFKYSHLDNVFSNPYESKEFNIFLVRNTFN